MNDIKTIVALAATHSTLVVDKGTTEIRIDVRSYRNPTEAALSALDAARYAPCTCWACNAENGAPCDAGQINGRED